MIVYIFKISIEMIGLSLVTATILEIFGFFFSLMVKNCLLVTTIILLDLTVTCQYKKVIGHFILSSQLNKHCL